LAGASGGTVTVQAGGNQSVWTDGGGVYPINTTSVTPGPGSNDTSVATTGWSQGTFVNAAGDGMSGGLGFGAATVGLAHDTSRHITLYDGFGGFSVTGGTINIVSQGTVAFVNSGGVNVEINDGGLAIRKGDAWLLRDPTHPMHATTKQYVDAKVNTGVSGYLPLTGGTITGNLQVNGNTGLIGTLNVNNATAVHRFSFHDNLGSIPPEIAGGYLAWNVTQGQGEVDFINGYSGYGGGRRASMNRPRGWREGVCLCS